MKGHDDLDLDNDRGRAAQAVPAVKLPAQETKEVQVQSLDQEGPLEEGMATHSSILAWRMNGQRSLAGYSPWGPKSRTRLKQLGTHTHKSGMRKERNE